MLISTVTAAIYNSSTHDRERNTEMINDLNCKYSLVLESFSTASKKTWWFSEKIYFDILTILPNSNQKQSYFFISKDKEKNTFNNKCLKKRVEKDFLNKS